MSGLDLNRWLGGESLFCVVRVALTKRQPPRGTGGFGVKLVQGPPGTLCSYYFLIPRKEHINGMGNAALCFHGPWKRMSLIQVIIWLYAYLIEAFIKWIYIYMALVQVEKHLDRYQPPSWVVIEPKPQSLYRLLITYSYQLDNLLDLTQASSFKPEEIILVAAE